VGRPQEATDVTAAEFFRETRQTFIRWNRKTLRRPMFLFFALVQPIVWFVLFTASFSSIAQLPGFPTDNYVTWFTAAVVIQTVIASSMQSGLGMVTDLESGFLDKMRVAPIHRSSILFGKLLSDAFRILLQSLIIIAIALAYQVNFGTGVVGIVLILVIASLFGIAWSGISNTLAFATKNSEITTMASLLTTFPLLFLSTAMMPVYFLPAWVQTVAKYNPLSYVADALHALVIGPSLDSFASSVLGPETGWTVLGYAFLTILVVGALTLTGASRMFRRTMSA